MLEISNYKFGIKQFFKGDDPMRTFKKVALVATLLVLGACTSIEVIDKDNGHVSVVYEKPSLIIGMIPTFTKRRITFDFVCTPVCIQEKAKE